MPIGTGRIYGGERAVGGELPPSSGIFRIPRIDGKLTDEAWSLAPVQGNLVQRDETRCRVEQGRSDHHRTFHDHRNAFYFSTNVLAKSSIDAGLVLGRYVTMTSAIPETSPFTLPRQLCTRMTCGRRAVDVFNLPQLDVQVDEQLDEEALLVARLRLQARWRVRS